VRGPHLAYRDDSFALEERDTRPDVALVSRARERCEPPLDLAVVEELGQLSVHERPFGRPKAAAPKLVAILQLKGLLRKPLQMRGFLFLRGSPTLTLPATEANAALFSLAAQHPGATRRTAPIDEAGTDVATK